LINHPEPENDWHVILVCKVTSGSCEYIVTKDVKIGDRDCCSCGVTDVENNFYTAYRFGTAGCWMTENLATTKNQKRGTTLTKGNSTTYDPRYTLPATSNTSDTQLTETQAKSSDYYGTGIGKPGFFYNWAAAVGATSGGTGTGGAQNTTTYPNKTATTTANDASRSATVNEDICPVGWHLPSDKEWSDLEKEITSNYTQYSTATTAPGAWSETYNDFRGGHSTLMRNPKNPSTSYTQSPAGLSNAKEKGFSGLLVGSAYSGTWYNYGVDTRYWSSSSYSGTTAWRRRLNYGNAGVFRNNDAKSYLWSVRCKKNEYN
jgi:uncharacterized protein (TIGR02145 family)